MDSMHVTFRRLSDEQVASFRPWYTCNALKIGWIFLLAIVGLKWITK
jgi:hypothetical protein